MQNNIENVSYIVVLYLSEFNQPAQGFFTTFILALLFSFSVCCVSPCCSVKYSLAPVFLQDPQRLTLNRAFADHCSGHRRIAARWRDPISRSPPTLTNPGCAYAVPQQVLSILSVGKEVIAQPVQISDANPQT